MTQKPQLLVTGASGYIGQRVLEALLDAGVQNIIATTRTPDQLDGFATRGVKVRTADFDDPTGLVEAFRGADRLLLISTNTLGVPGKRIAQHRNAIEAAQEAGVAHVVYTSFGKPSADSTLSILADHYATEQALAASPLGWTILRNNLYMESLVETLKRAMVQGQLANGIGDGRIGYVTRADCARAAAAAVATDFTGQRILDITGPSAPRQAELAALASEITKTPIPYVALTTEAVVAGMEQAGLPRPVAQMLAAFDGLMAQGGFDVVSDSVEMLTGVAPMGVEAYLQARLSKG